MDTLFEENSILEQPKSRRRAKKRSSEPKFIHYSQEQPMLLPPSLEELISEKHIVRVVNKLVESMDIKPLKATYKGGGRSAYNPLMLMKVLVYGYLMKIYSSRRIAKALREDINFMWLSGMQRPDFRTINNFRSGRLRRSIEEVFSSMIIFLSENRYIRLESYFVDGTDIEANANKHSYVWRVNAEKYNKRVKEKVKELLKQIEIVNQKEDAEYGDKDLEEVGEQSEEISIEKIEEEVKKINKRIERIQQEEERENKQEEKVKEKRSEGNSRIEETDKQTDKIKRTKRILKQIEGQYIPRLKKYKEQMQILRGRNSYSKTDTDATFFRTKTGELLPSYKLIIGTEGQLIINYSIHQKPSESDYFIGHIEKLKSIGIGRPKNVVADAGYGYEENYRYLDDEMIEGYLKCSGLKRMRRGDETSKYAKENFHYDKQRDIVICPEGREMRFNRREYNKRVTGYIQQVDKYQGDCRGCKGFAKCVKSGEERKTIGINKRLEEYKEKARERLNSSKGIELGRRRGIEVESVFGDIKHNQGFRRFNLRGIEKVSVEFGLVAIAHNVKKLAEIKN